MLASVARRNLEAVRTGATTHDPGADDYLLRVKAIKVNRRTGWYDLTPSGREWLAVLNDIPSLTAADCEVAK